MGRHRRHQAISHYTKEVPLQYWDLRRLFNEGHFKQRAEQGEFRIEPGSRPKPLAPDKVASIPNLQSGAISETILYLDLQTGNLVVQLHRYRNQDDTLGASGLDDPLQIIIKNVRYHRTPKTPWRLSSWQLNRILDKHGAEARETYIETFRGYRRHYDYLLSQGDSKWHALWVILFRSRITFGL